MIISNKQLYPFYAKCVELGVPMGLHSSMSFSNRPMYMSYPMHIDQVALDFPELNILFVNPGFPWVNELVALAWRHPRVHICTSAVRAKYLGHPSADYQMLIHHANSMLADKFIYASSYPLLPFDRNLEEAKQLPLKVESMKKFLGDNIARILKMESKP